MTFEGPFWPKPLNDSVTEKLRRKKKAIVCVGSLWSIHSASNQTAGKRNFQRQERQYQPKLCLYSKGTQAWDLPWWQQHSILLCAGTEFLAMRTDTAIKALKVIPEAKRQPMQITKPTLHISFYQHTTADLDSSHGFNMASRTLIRFLCFSFPKGELKQWLQPSPARAIVRNAAVREDQRLHPLPCNPCLGFSFSFNTKKQLQRPNWLQTPSIHCPRFLPGTASPAHFWPTATTLHLLLAGLGSKKLIWMQSHHWCTDILFCWCSHTQSFYALLYCLVWDPTPYAFK